MIKLLFLSQSKIKALISDQSILFQYVLTLSLYQFPKVDAYEKVDYVNLFSRCPKLYLKVSLPLTASDDHLHNGLLAVELTIAQLKGQEDGTKTS